MSEKRVSVRLVAEGGRQVRAELEGIGEAGSHGFGRLSSEMERANARMASFSRRAGIALAAVTAAAAAAGVAMVRSGLANIDAQAKLAQSMRTTVESVQTLTWAGELAGVSMGEIEQATKKLTTRLSEAATGSGSAVAALKRLNLTAAELQALPLDQRIVAIQEALTRYVPEAERAAVASDYREAAGMLAEAAGRPLASWQALKDAVTGTGDEGADALGRATDAADALTEGFDEAGRAGGGAGAAAKKAAEEAAAGWDQVIKSLADYARDAKDWGKGLGETLVSAFTSAESAFRKFVTTGKFDFKSLISSILADLATLAFKNSVLGPLANWLSKGLGGIFAPVKHAGGMVGAPGPGRMVTYLDTFRWLFILLALGGIAVAIWARIDDWKKGQR